jgi:hypothetical protein
MQAKLNAGNKDQRCTFGSGHSALLVIGLYCTKDTGDSGKYHLSTESIVRQVLSLANQMKDCMRMRTTKRMMQLQPEGEFFQICQLNGEEGTLIVPLQSLKEYRLPKTRKFFIGSSWALYSIWLDCFTTQTAWILFLSSSRHLNLCKDLCSQELVYPSGP